MPVSSRQMVRLVEVRCARCTGYLFSVPASTPFRTYCRACGLKFEDRAG